MKVICIIPARAGSVGIKHKNLKLIHGKSLVGWAVTVGTKVLAIDKVVISTDSEEIAEEAILHGATFIKFRSPELSGPSVHDQQVLIETLTNCEAALNCQFDIVMMLQPTSPLRSIKEIDNCLFEVGFLNKSACWTVSKVDAKYHYRKQLSVGDKSELQMSVIGPRVVSRQELSPTFIRNGACYVFTRETLINDPQLLGNNCGYVVSEGIRPNIDVIEDLYHAIETSYVNAENGLLQEKREVL